jgi:hypothetical protein
MNEFEVLETVWQLTNHPFAPTSDDKGNPIDPKVVKRTLDPTIIPNITSFYFDIYDWKNSLTIRGLSNQDGFLKFPNIDELKDNHETLVVIVSGYSDSGVRSLVNMVRFKASKTASQPPLFFYPPLEGRGHDKAGLAKTIVDFFIQKYVSEGTKSSKPSKASLDKTYDKYVKELEKDPNSYQALPRTILDMVRPQCSRPFVLVVDVNDKLYYETWKNIYDVCRGFVQLVIIPTRNPYWAKTFFTSYKNGMRLVHIQSDLLNKDRAVDYLRQRIGLFRHSNQQNVQTIDPFTEDAIKTLFRDGSQPDPNQSIEFPIGMLNKTFCYALDKLINQLKVVEKKDLGSLSKDKLFVQSTIIDQVRREINEGLY